MKLNRRQLLQALGLGALSGVVNMPGAAKAGPSTSPTRILFYVQPHGHIPNACTMPIPDAPTTAFAERSLTPLAAADLSPTLRPLHPFRDKLIAIEGLSNTAALADSWRSGETIDAKAYGRYEARNYLEAFRAVGYPGLTFTNFYAPATFHTSTVDVKTAPGLRIAYLPGTGDDVPAYLPYIGITPTILKIKDLNASTLANFDAVLLGVRAYAAHPELAGEGSKPLLDFAADGGVVIVQYNSGGSSGKAAPFPFELPGDSAHNVVVETQPVTILSPQNPLLKWPNSLDSHDFDHWSEEWGHGFASSWDPKYETPLEVHDPDQDPQKGGLLIAKTGKGAYIYCAFALYRQFPEGVPGAYRLMANLLSYVKNPSR